MFFLSLVEETITLLKSEGNAYYAFNLYANQEIELRIKEIVKKHGAFDGLAYCAGIGGVRPLSFTKHPFIQEMMNANVYSFIETIRCITKKNCFIKGGSYQIAINNVVWIINFY